MLPTLRSGDMVLLTKGYPQPRRGDIVFTRVMEQGAPVEIVKRVIALPGDTVEIRNDVAIVNGVNGARARAVRRSDGRRFRRVLPRPGGSVYVMGDNRPDSEDSRYIGPVPALGREGPRRCRLRTHQPHPARPLRDLTAPAALTTV